MRTSSKAIAGALLACALIGIAPPAQAQGYSIEKYSLKLTAPQGYCALDPSNAADAPIIRRWQHVFAQAPQQLVVAAVECSQLEAFRKPPLLLVDFSQALVVYDPRYESAPLPQRAGLPKALCAHVRQESGQAAGESVEQVEQRMITALATLKTGESQVIGILDEEPAACYVVVVARAQTVSNAPASVLHVRATSVIQGRILQFYQTAHTADGKERAALARMAALLKQNVKAQLAANP